MVSLPLIDYIRPQSSEVERLKNVNMVLDKLNPKAFIQNLFELEDMYLR